MTLLLTLNFYNHEEEIYRSQIVAAIKKQEAGLAVKEIFRKMGISDFL